MAATERDVPQGFVEFAENTSAILQVHHLLRLRRR